MSQEGFEPTTKGSRVPLGPCIRRHGPAFALGFRHRVAAGVQGSAPALLNDLLQRLAFCYIGILTHGGRDPDEPLPVRARALRTARSAAYPLDAAKDVDELLRASRRRSRWGARMTHRKCGASFLVRLED